MADSARDAQSVDDRLINLEVNLATLYRLLNLDVAPSAAFSSEKRRLGDGAPDAALDLPATWKRHCALTSKQEDNSEIPSNRMQRSSESLASTTQIENLASTTHIENLASKIVDIENTLQQIARCAGETMKTIYGPEVLDLVNRGELPRHRDLSTPKHGLISDAETCWRRTLDHYTTFSAMEWESSKMKSSLAYWTPFLEGFYSAHLPFSQEWLAQGESIEVARMAAREEKCLQRRALPAEKNKGLSEGGTGATSCDEALLDNKHWPSGEFF